jgi:ribosome-binding factor A
MNSTRQNKVARLLQKELSELFQREARNLFGGALITVTIVRISPDLSEAKIYLSIFGVKNTEEILKLVKTNYKIIRSKLGEKVKNQLRIVPNLSFFIDDSLDYAEKIDQLLKQ